MVNMKETTKEFFMISILGLGTKILSIFVSGWLDSKINHSISNLIGLFLNAFLDFFMIKKVFKKQEEKSSKFIGRYTVSIILTLITAQLLYMGFHSYMSKYHSEWVKKEWDKYVFWVRYVVGGLAYSFVEFPLHKFWVFKTNT